MKKLRCINCGKTFNIDLPLWQCICGGMLEIEFQPKLALKRLKQRGTGLWRYREVIPIEDDHNIISFNEGFTPLIEIKIDRTPVYFKMDFLFPTGSFKDRGATVLVSKVKELKIQKVIIDSSGNAGCAVSAYCAKAGIECLVLVPETASEEKLNQIKSYGAKLYVVEGTRDETARVALKLAQEVYYASHYYNPFFLHGTKTFAYEVVEQLNWNQPDAVILPVGNGSLLLGAYIGFKELYTQGLIKKLPKLIGVQATACNPLYKMLKYNLNKIPNIVRKTTIAEGIAVTRPPRAHQILRAIKNTKGTILAVTDAEIRSALDHACKLGIYLEPTAAVGLAGVKKYLKGVGKKECIVSVFTGTGLKSHKR